ncbi:hypothetical protein HRbin36_01552 [bacterium HR36]|nr:hypothetical protein HRbin36_01552 [bacterium HR36]
MIDLNNSGVFIAIPGKIRLHNIKFIIRIGAEPTNIKRNGFASKLQSFAGHGFVFGECQDPDTNPLDTSTMFAETVAANETEITGGRAGDGNTFKPGRCGFLRDDSAGTSNLLVGRKGYSHMVSAGFLIEGLVPGNKGNGVPARLIVISQDGIPVGQHSDAMIMSPASLEFGELQSVVECDGNRRPLGDGKRQGYH